MPGYSIELSKKLVQGADIWLNTPIRGIEACGTSGMKAGLNGALQMSVSDGWVGEVDWSGFGWVLPDGDPARAAYEFLEKEALPAYYKRGEDGLPKRWIGMMRATMDVVETRFTAARMLKEYRDKLYKA
jgi:starch phosphorylase